MSISDRLLRLVECLTIMIVIAYESVLIGATFFVAPDGNGTGLKRLAEHWQCNGTRGFCLPLGSASGLL